VIIERKINAVANYILKKYERIWEMIILEINILRIVEIL
jgi:hypothetical protein